MNNSKQCNLYFSQHQVGAPHSSEGTWTQFPSASALVPDTSWIKDLTDKELVLIAQGTAYQEADIICQKIVMDELARRRPVQAEGFQLYHWAKANYTAIAVAGVTTFGLLWLLNR